MLHEKLKVESLGDKIMWVTLPIYRQALDRLTKAIQGFFTNGQFVKKLLTFVNGLSQDSTTVERSVIILLEGKLGVVWNCWPTHAPMSHDFISWALPRGRAEEVGHDHVRKKSMCVLAPVQNYYTSYNFKVKYDCTLWWGVWAVLHQKLELYRAHTPRALVLHCPTIRSPLPYAVYATPAMQS